MNFLRNILIKKTLLITLILQSSILLSNESSSTTSSSSSTAPSISSESSSSSSGASLSSLILIEKKFDDKAYYKYLCNRSKKVDLDPSIRLITYEEWVENGQKLIKSIILGDNEGAKKLLNSEEVNPNACDIHGKTALFYVPNKEIATLLITKGANVNIKDKKGWTPLLNQLSRFITYKEDLYNYLHIDIYQIIELLLTNGAVVHNSNLIILRELIRMPISPYAKEYKKIAARLYALLHINAIY